MGRLLSKLPTDVHLGKFLLMATLFRCLDPALTIAATLNSKSPFVSPFGMEQEADRAKNSFRTGKDLYPAVLAELSGLQKIPTSWPFITHSPAGDKLQATLVSSVSFVEPIF
jgi:ATP-dependent RNA helicase DHX29